MKNQKNVFIIFCFGVLVATAMSGMAIEKMKAKHVCNDTRLYMDGGIDATVEEGGLSPRTSVIVYRQKNMKKVELAKLNDVKSQRVRETTGTGERYSAKDFTLFIADQTRPNSNYRAGTLEGLVADEKVSAQLNCVRQ